MTDNLTENEKLILSHVENMVMAHNQKLIVTKRVYELMLEKVGKEWVEKNLIENQPVPTA